jgi:PAS domain S-box-containing protein
MDKSDNREKRSLSVFIIIFFILSVGIVTAGYLYYQNYAKHYRVEVEQRLLAVGELKISELVQYRNERLGDGNILFKNNVFSSLVRRYFKNPGDTDAQRQLYMWLSKYPLHYQYDAVSLLDTQGVTRIAIPNKQVPFSSDIIQSVPAILRKGQVVLQDFYRNAYDHRIYLTVLVPVLDGIRPLGVLALRIDPTIYIYPFLSRWPSSSRTVETLLVRREGNEVLFLKELKFKKDTALNLRIPLGKGESPAVQSVLGHQGIVEGKDYRGIPVIAYVHDVPDSPWFLVAQMDISEVDAPLRERLWIMVILISVLIVGSGAGMGIIWRHQSAIFYRERYEALEAVRESEGKYRTLVENIPQKIFTKDRRSVYLSCNELYARDLGITPEEIIGKTDYDFFPKELADKYSSDDTRVMESGETENIEEQYIQGGEKGWIYTVKTPVRDKEGHIIGILGVFSDITERKRAEEERKAYIRFLENLERVDQAIKVETDMEQMMWHILEIVSSIFDCDRAWLFYPCDPDAPTFRVPMEITRPECPGAKALNVELPMPPDMAWNLREALESDEPVIYIAGTERPINKVTAEQFGVQSQMFVPIYAKLGKPWVFGMHQCSYPRVWTKEEKKLFMEISRRISDGLSSGLFLRELHDHYFTQATINMILSESLENIPLELMLQKALNMILSIPWLSFESIGSIHLVEGETGELSMKAQYNLPEQLEKMCAHVSLGKCLCGRAALTKKIEFADHIDERHEICYEGMQPHGHYIVPILFGSRTLGVIDIYLKEGHSRDQKEEEFLLMVADTLAGIIERKKVEEEKEKLHEQLLQAQKMEAVGQLAGGIAHDFNNILSAMIGYGHLLQIKLKEDDPLRIYADHILSLSDRAANLTQSLLAFSRKQIMNPKTVDMNEIIRKVERLLARIIGEDIELKSILAEKELIIMADPLQIEQVLMNLATNARDAMPEGGKLEIITEEVEFDELFIKTSGYGKAGRYAHISVSDNGSGMDEETREHIFEPFFTTKEVGKGTGLGLAMAYGIIKQHNGDINVYSEPGRGTIFRIYLPLIEAKTEEIKPEDIQVIKKGTETVLLAEDGAEVREFTKNLLEEYGYNVIITVDGQNAIDEFKVYKDKIQLLLLDVIMPNKNGKEAYEEIKQIKPDIRALFMSGYPADVLHKHGILEKGLAYIEKPISPANLLKIIREVLDSS